MKIKYCSGMNLFYLPIIKAKTQSKNYSLRFKIIKFLGAIYLCVYAYVYLYICSFNIVSVRSIYYKYYQMTTFETFVK